MKLKSINLKNYRSVEDIIFHIKENNDKSFTYGLIGVNEAGKSSVLKGIALIDNLAIIKITQKDFYNKSNPISIEYKYYFEDIEINEFLNFSLDLIEASTHDTEDFRSFTIKFDYPYDSYSIPLKTVVFKTKKKIYNILLDNYPELSLFFNAKLHKTIFWTADEKHLITNTINLIAFANDPDNVSVPLKNCFKLAGIDNIAERIGFLEDSTERESLREELGLKVTEHIKRVWPKHPIKITFDISNGNIHFHVKDENVIGKSKTADQRSDGFKQFISFLLTLSAENINSELKNTIILLDEPETHLHPRAQEDLLKELISITNGNNNIVFFATHSNYMIDKSHLSRNYKVTKPKDITMIESFDDKLSSYASVNYDVFEIASTDYHNELYGKAQELCGIENGTAFDKKIEELIENCPIKKDYVHTSGKKFDCTLPTYIRHLIHHPENPKNKKFTDSELEKSTVILLDLITILKPAK
jgi:AAA15 family ATPase/GTPase